MAFKILDSKEISLLDDNQRIEYEKNLKLYQQRVAFVERLEMLENVHIEPFEPQLKRISVIDAIEVIPFEKTEYVMSVCDPKIKTDIQIKSFKTVEQISPVLPVVPRQVDVQDKHIQKIERNRPDLPLVAKPEVFMTSFERLENSKPNLPIIESPKIKTDMIHEDLRKNICYVPNGMPKVAMPDIEINYDAVPVKTQPYLPAVSVCTADIVTFIKPEKNIVELPSVTKPNIDIGYRKKSQKVKPALPEVAMNFNLTKEFRKPELRKIDLPAVDSPNVNVECQSVIKPVQLSMPEISMVLTVNKEFCKPKQSKAELPQINKLNIDVQSFRKIEHSIPNLSNLTDIDLKLTLGDFSAEFPRSSVIKLRTLAVENHENKKINVPTVKISTELMKFGKIRNDITVPSKPEVIVKAFKRKQKNISKLPVINIAEVPDAYSSLKQLLVMSDDA